MAAAKWLGYEQSHEYGDPPIAATVIIQSRRAWD